MTDVLVIGAGLSGLRGKGSAGDNGLHVSV